MQNIITLENWRFVTKPKNVLQRKSPCEQYYLIGTCINHPRFPNNIEIHTSIVVGKKDDLIETKEGHLYFLKDPAKEWAKRFPNSAAKEHLLSILTEIG